MRLISKLMAGIFVLTSVCTAQTAAPNPLKTYIKEDAPVIVLINVRLIDGTGEQVRERMRIDIDHGKIVNVQSAMLRNAFPPNAKVIDLEGKTVFPGLVGMHETCTTQRHLSRRMASSSSAKRRIPRRAFIWPPGSRLRVLRAASSRMRIFNLRKILMQASCRDRSSILPRRISKAHPHWDHSFMN